MHTYNILALKMENLKAATYIETPKTFDNPRSGLINIKNDDNECFKYCILYHQSNKTDHARRTTALKKIENKYIMTDITYPATYQDVEQFEKNNENVSINIFYHNKEKDEI